MGNVSKERLATPQTKKVAERCSRNSVRLRALFDPSCLF